jgi:hypothetical protein
MRDGQWCVGQSVSSVLPVGGVVPVARLSGLMLLTQSHVL